MAYTTKKPTGLSIKRSGSAFVVSWKIGDKDYGEGQTFQWRVSGGKWQTVAIGSGTTKKTIAVTAADFFPTTSKKLAALYVRIRGRRKDFKNGNETVNPQVSAWAEKTYDVLVPARPKLTVALDPDHDNVCTFTWTTNVANDSARWFVKMQCQTALVANSNITDGSKIPNSEWAAHSATGANSSANIVEDTSVINDGNAHTRWFRLRSLGPQGWSDWTYARHVYSVPYQTKNVSASATETDAGGYLCSAQWQTPKDASHPVDGIHVQYAFAAPDIGLTCPDTATWSDAMTLKYKDGSDAAAFSLDSVVGADQCLFIRINTIHDRTITYGLGTLAAVGRLKTPTGLSVSTDQDTYRATVSVSNASDVEDSFLVVRYMTADDPDGFDIGIIPHGQSSVTVQCPVWASTSGIKFGVYAAVGSYRATTRADGVASYAVTSLMKSAMVSYGGTIPAAPQSVTVSRTNIPGTIRVAFDWSWQDATNAELSWADHADAWESTAGPETYLLNNTHASAWNISGLETGKTWYIRVRLVNGSGQDATYGAYSNIVSIDLSSAPAIPILSLSSGVITEDGTVTASWAYVSTDGSVQAYAEVAEVGGTGSSGPSGATGATGQTGGPGPQGDYTIIATTESAQHVTIAAADAGWAYGESHMLAVRVSSASGRMSEWSDPVAVIIAQPLEAEITQISLEEQTITVDGVSRTVNSLTEMPMTVTVTGAGEGGTTTVIIERAETYHVTRPDETEFNGFEGETVAIFSQTGEDQIVISNDDLVGYLDDGAGYRLIATVQDGLGQSAEVVQEFEVHWDHQAQIPDAFADVMQEQAVAVLYPIAPAGAAETDVCDIYRLSVDRPELIYEGATFGGTYVDPYPAIGPHGGHRFVLRTENGDYITEDDELAWTDLREAEGDTLDSNRVIIDFGTGRVFLEYDIDVTHTWKKDFTETKYLGGSVQGDWNPAVSRNGTISGVTVVDDVTTIEEMRRLAVYAGICHVRTPDGSSYAADVQVSEGQKQGTGHNAVEFSLTITRVDVETLDGMTYAEWQETGGIYGG